MSIEITIEYDQIPVFGDALDFLDWGYGCICDDLTDEEDEKYRKAYNLLRDLWKQMKE